MNKKNIIYLTLSGFFIVSGLSIVLFFYFKHKNNINSEQNNTNDSQKIDEIVEKNEIDNSTDKNKKSDIDIKKLTHNEQFNDKLLKIKIEVEYPIILNKNYSDFIDKINKKNKSEAEKDFNEYKSKLQEIAKEPIKYDNYQDLFFYRNCEIKRNDNIISMLITDSWYAGGVIDYSLKSKNYNLKNKKELTLADILNGSKENIDRMITEKIKKYLGSDHDLYYEYFQKHDLKDYKFHIENKNSQDILVIDFSKYEISDGAAGAISIEIPFSEIKQKYKIEIKIEIKI